MASCKPSATASAIISDNYDPLIRSGQMTLLGGNQEQEIVPGISVEVWPGHTRNMWAVFVRSGRQDSLLYL